MISPFSLLPPTGWTQHAEQVTPAAIEAKAFNISTTLVGGVQVKTAQALQVEPESQRMFEQIAAHQRGCTDPRCNLGRHVNARELVDAAGKFRSDVPIFVTNAVAPDGEKLWEFFYATSAPEAAVKNHIFAVSCITGAMANWRHISAEPV